jgi:Tol biopolymer transport system component
MLVYAGGRMVGNKASDYDIKIISPGTKASFLTATQHSAERWPAWHPDGKSIFYTVEGSKELSILKFDLAVKKESLKSNTDSMDN